MQKKKPKKKDTKKKEKEKKDALGYAKICKSTNLRHVIDSSNIR